MKTRRSASAQNMIDNDPRGDTPPAGKASDYIGHAERDIKPGDKVVLYCRVSRHTQNRMGNLDDQERNLRREAARLGAIVVEDPILHEGPGWDAGEIMRAAALAREHGAKLLAESTNRYVRSGEYHGDENPDAQASEEELQFLPIWTGGTVPLTVLDPDASAGEERAYETKRGQREKGRRGGRPRTNPPGYKTERRREMLPKVLELREKGESVREIAAYMGIAKSTIYDWIQQD